ncbi:MAG: protein kinase [Planctomycetes bacterium]|nr:protein kinase [Planctomycetota bacterium]
MTGLHITDCPSAEQLLAFDQGDLPDQELIATADHLGVCGRCRDRLAEALCSATDPLLLDLRKLADGDTSVGHTIDPTGVWTQASPAQAAGSKPTATGEPEAGIAASSDPDGTLAAPNHPPTFDSPLDAAPALDTFGQYQLFGKLGEGGMGVVFRGRDPRLKRTVALKMLKAGHVSEEQRSRFLAEAQAVARLQHANVVQIYDIGEVAGQLYCALEFVPGGSLDRRIMDTLPDPRTAARLMIPIARGVQAAHELKIVHRDLKPANILLSGGKDTPLDACIPKVTDFGLAKFLDAEDGGATRANAVMGTPSYMSPEQAEGRIADIGPQADVYSLGATLYDLLSGRPPFKGTTLRDTLKLVIEQEPVPPRQLQTKVPRDLETICLKCLQKAPDRRYASAAELADDLQRFLNGEPITARPVSRFEKAWRWCRRKPAVAALSGFSAVAVMGLLVGAFAFTYAVADERREKEVAKERSAKDQAERETAEVKKQSAEEMHKASDYFAQLARARERLVTRESGWSWAAIDDIKAAAKIDTPSRNPAALRSALASALAGTDVRESRPLGEGFHSRVLCYHPNGRWLVMAEGRIGQGFFPLGVLVVDTQTGETVRKLAFPSRLVGTLTDVRPDMANAIAVSPDGHWLVVGARSGAIHRWDLRSKNPEVQSWTPEQAPFGKWAECHGLAFAPNGSSLYVSIRAGDNGTITRWDTTTWERKARHSTEGAFGGLVVHSGGEAVYCNGNEATILELDPATLMKRPGTIREFGAHAVSPDGRLLAATRDRKVTLWDTRKRTPAYTLTEPHREHAFGHLVGQIQFSPDGRLLVATSEHTRHVYLFDLVTGERVATWRADEGTAYATFDPTSRFLAIAGRNRTAVLEIGGQLEHRTVAAQPYPFLAAGLSPDGRLLAGTVSESTQPGSLATPYLWNLEAEGRSEPFWTHGAYGAHGSFSSASFTPSGSDLAVVIDGELKVYDRLGGKEGPPLTRIDGLRSAAFAPDGRLWVIADKHVYSARLPGDIKDSPRWTNPAGRIGGLESMHSLAVGKSWSIAGGLDGVLRLFSTSIPEGAKQLVPEKSILIESRVGLESLAFSSDESLAVVGTASGKGYIVALPGGTILATWDSHRDTVTGAAFLTPTAFVTGSGDRTIRFWSWDGERVSELWTLRTTSAITSLGKSLDGQRLTVTCDGERGVHLLDMAALNRRFAEVGLGIDLPKPQSLPRLPIFEPPTTISDDSNWTANGLRMELFADREHRVLRVVERDPAVNWNWGWGQPHPHVPLVFSARWSGFVVPPADGKYQFRITGENAIRVWLGGKLVAESWELDRSGDVNLTFAADLTAEPQALRVDLAHGSGGPAFLTLSWAKPGDFSEQPVSAAFLFHDETAAKVAKVPKDPSPANEVSRFTAPGVTGFTRVATSRDGRFVAAGSKEGGLYVWEADGGKAVTAIKDAHTGPVTALDISPDGGVLVSSASDGPFAVWELPSGKLLARNEVHRGGSRVAFSPDGKRFATSGADKTAREWDTKTRVGGGIANIAFVPNTIHWEPAGAAILLSGENGTAVRWDPGAGKQSAISTETPGRMGFAFVPGGRLVTTEEYRSRGDKGVLRLLDTTVGVEQWSVRFEDVVNTVAVSPDGKWVAAAVRPVRLAGQAPLPRGSESVGVYNLATGRESNKLVGHVNSINDISFHIGGKTVFTAADDGTVRGWRSK